ncbi:MAG: molecular chaperone HtpG [Chromatiales bacterium]|jgi:molecular chaperone HtpG|nr:molecular chaperone HtpG [Chromatiales bacterium]
MEIHSTQVNLTGLLDVLGRNLYSTPNVVIRELVQNAHDSCIRRSLEAPEGPAARIDVTVDAAAQTFTIADSGAGLTEAELHTYLATVGSGYTKILNDSTTSADLIGRFGLGFLSAYVVSHKVEVWTCSYQTPGDARHYVSNGGERYWVTPAAPQAIGTRVTLHLSEQFAQLADADSVDEELSKYCALLNTPVHLNGTATPVNSLELPWRTEHAEGSARYRRLCQQVVETFEPHFDAVCTIPIVPLPGISDARGLLWIHDSATYGTSDNRNLSVFVRGMLVAEDARDLLPTWAGWLGGIIESDVLTPTASRESLQKDDHYERVCQHIKHTLIDGLAELPSLDRPTWRRVLNRHNEALLGAAICESQLFELLSDDLRLPTTEGDLTMPAILGRSGERIHVSSGEQRGAEEIVFKALRQPVVLGNRYGALAFSSEYARLRDTRMIILGTEAGNRELFRAVTLDVVEREALEALFTDTNHDVQVAAFEPPDIPLLAIVDREAFIKARLESDNVDARVGSAALRLARLYTATIEQRRTHKRFINFSSPLIRRLLKLPPARQKTLADLLTAFSVASGARDDGDGGSQLDNNLNLFNHALLALLEDAQGPDQ